VAAVMILICLMPFIAEPLGIPTQVRQAPSWPRSWANFSLL
jgi:hypothetical protein